MLDPNTRYLYLEEFRPPAGYTADLAIGTTFSLDLVSLLMVPVTMTKIECQGQKEITEDPVLLLESLRKTAGRITVFCQQGRIVVPKADSRLYSYLEEAVVEVQPPYASREGGVFHPKIWVIRFVSEHLPVMYRVLCLSRNLTFDRSWDTILTLEGTLLDRARGFSQNRPLSDFLYSLPRLAVRPVSEKTLEQVEKVAGEVLRVKFDPPDGFDSFSFLPLGIKGYRRAPVFQRHSRLLVISPFLSREQLEPLMEHGEGNILITRPDSLDALTDEDYEKLRKRAHLFVLDESGVSLPEESEAEDIGTASFSGLHAKLYLSEEGWDARLVTGSANATNAAMSGPNVEFLIEMKGKRSRVGIDKLLGDGEKKDTFQSLLIPYHRKAQSELDEAATVRQMLEKELEEARRRLARSELALKVFPEDNRLYQLHLTADKWLMDDDHLVSARCYPVSLKPALAQDMANLKRGNPVIFKALSLAELTSFMVIDLKASSRGISSGLSFVLNLPLTGLPKERDQAVIRSIVSDQSAFLRYLILLLDDEDEPDGTGGSWLRHVMGSSPYGVSSGTWIPLLEEMVKSLSRNPEKIDRIAQLVADLKGDPDAGRILPPGFDDIWEAFVRFRNGDGK